MSGDAQVKASVWDGLLRSAREGSFSDRRDSVVQAAGYTEEVLRRLGIYAARGSSDLWPSLALVCQAMRYPRREQDCLHDATRLRNEISHQPTFDPNPTDAVRAIAAFRDCIVFMVRAIAAAGALSQTDTNASTSDSMKLTSPAQKLLHRYGIRDDSLDSIFASVRSMLPVARVGFWADFQGSLERGDASTREQLKWLREQVVEAAVRLNCLEELRQENPQRSDAGSQAVFKMHPFVLTHMPEYLPGTVYVPSCERYAALCLPYYDAYREHIEAGAREGASICVALKRWRQSVKT